MHRTVGTLQHKRRFKTDIIYCHVISVNASIAEIALWIYCPVLAFRLEVVFPVRTAIEKGERKNYYESTQ